MQVTTAIGKDLVVTSRDDNARVEIAQGILEALSGKFREYNIGGELYVLVGEPEAEVAYCVRLRTAVN